MKKFWLNSMKETLKTTQLKQMWNWENDNEKLGFLPSFLSLFDLAKLLSDFKKFCALGSKWNWSDTLQLLAAEVLISHQVFKAIKISRRQRTRNNKGSLITCTYPQNISCIWSDNWMLKLPENRNHLSLGDDRYQLKARLTCRLQWR